MAEQAYTNLASWWPVLSPPEDYDELAVVLMGVMQQGLSRPLQSILELGSATGHLGSHVPAQIELVLNDLRPEMLEVSRKLCPEREHVCGDLRTLELGRRFDAVLIHDVLMYLSAPEDIAAAIHTAKAHLKPGGVLLLVPDAVLETVEPGIAQGGGDAPDGRSARFIEWHHQADESGAFRVDFSFLLREADGTVRQVHDVHNLQAHPFALYGRLLAEAGFEQVDPGELAEVHGGLLILARLTDSASQAG